MKLYICEENRKDESFETLFFKSIDDANAYAWKQFEWLANVEKVKDFTLETGEAVGDFPEDIDITDCSAIWECNGNNYDILDCDDALHLDSKIGCAEYNYRKQHNYQGDIWYAVMKDDDDNDWGYGGYTVVAAAEMLKDYPNGHIEVIADNQDPIVIDRIDYDDAMDIAGN